MLKKLSELTKDEKILLLKSVANKDIEPEQYNKNSLFAIEYKDAFLGLMMQSGNKDLTVCYIGAAREAKKLIDSYTAPPALSFERIESSLLYKCKETGEEFTGEQIKAMEKDYFTIIEIVSDLKQPPDGFHLIPKSKEMFINDLQVHK